MSVYQRDGVWYARAQVGRRRIERSAGKGATKQTAKELEETLYRRLREDLHAKRVGKSLNRTFGEALLEYLKLPETKRLRAYQSMRSVAHLIRPYLEHIRLEDTPQAAEQMKQALLAEGLQPATINRRLAMVRRILKLAYHQWKWLTQPLAVTLLPENNERHVYPPMTLVRELMKACHDRDDADALLVAYFTGMRRGELLRVNENPKTHVEGDFINLYSGNKTKKPGRIPIASEIRPIIDRMPLPITRNTIRRNFETARQVVGQPGLRWNDLRHGFASLIADAGGDFLDVMKLLRHTSAQSTKRYTHLLDRRLTLVVGRATAGKRRSDDRDQDADESVSA